MNIKSRFFVSVALRFVALVPCRALATQYYVTETANDNAGGTGDGLSLATSWSRSQVNTGGLPCTGGDTVHLDGTLEGNVSWYMSGTSTSSKLTILFDSGANITAPVFTGSPAAGLYIFEQNYITVDGGANGQVGPSNYNGFVECTANGSTLANQVDAYGIYGVNCSYLLVQNLAVLDIYVHSSASDGNPYGHGVTDSAADGPNQTDFEVKNCYIRNAFEGAATDYNSGCGPYTFDFNYIEDCNWSIGVGDRGPSSSMGAITVNNNTLCNWSNWYDTADDLHHNGLFVFSTEIGSTGASSVTSYGNTYGPGYDTSPSHNTAGIYIDGGSGTTFLSHNDLFLAPSGQYSANGLLTFGGPPIVGIFNDEFIANSTNVTAIQGQGGGVINLQNNIYVGNNTGTFIAIFNNGGTIATIDNNLAYDPDPSNAYSWSSGSSGVFYNLAGWNNLGFDVLSTKGYTDKK